MPFVNCFYDIQLYYLRISRFIFLIKYYHNHTHISIKLPLNSLTPQESIQYRDELLAKRAGNELEWTGRRLKDYVMWQIYLRAHSHM